VEWAQVALGDVCMCGPASVSRPSAVCAYRMRGSVVSLLYTTGQRVFSIGRERRQQAERIKVHGSVEPLRSGRDFRGDLFPPCQPKPFALWTGGTPACCLKVLDRRCGMLYRVRAWTACWPFTSTLPGESKERPWTS
jgi:hypothetical protein